MEDRPPRDDWEDEPTEGSRAPESFPIADVVSVQSLANVLIRKGICTPEELYQEEQRRRQENTSAPRTTIVQTPPSQRVMARENGSGHRHKSGWLKRKMSKKRWTRRLGSLVFGWEWKKVKTNRGNQPLEDQE